MWKNIFLESCLLSALIFGGLYINANYIKKRLSSSYSVPYSKGTMHEFVISAQKIKFVFENSVFQQWLFVEGCTDRRSVLVLLTAHSTIRQITTHLTFLLIINHLIVFLIITHLTVGQITTDLTVRRVRIHIT